MASLHQWKKYKVAYNWVWDAEYNEYTNKYKDFIFSTDHCESYSDCKIYQGYIIKNGEFVLTNPKNAEDAVKGDVLYGYFHTTSGGDQYGYDKTYHYNVGIYYTEDRKTLYKFILNNRMRSYSNESYNGDYTHYYLTSDSDASLEGYYNPYKKQTTPKQGSYVGLVQGQEGTYPKNGQKGDFWYVYDKALNASPAISGSDLDLGSKTEDFYIDYVVSDSDGDVVTVDILVDDVVKVEGKSVPLGVNQKYLVSLDDFSLGDHKIEIRARDSKGAEAPSRTYYFSKANTAPRISGSDIDLGNKSTGFTISYRVDDKDADSVNVRISLDDKEMSSISDAQGKDLRFTLDDSKVRELEIGKTYTITIKADDGKGGVAYRRYSFTKVNTPPIISGVDKDLGKVKVPQTIKFSVSDVEKDKIYFSLLLDGKEVMSQEGAVDGKEYSYKIDHDTFIRLTYGKHELKLLAWDDENIDKKAVRKFSFERISGGLDVEIKLAEYDTQPKKIVAVPHGEFIDTKIFQVLACNNYLDAKPTWEDITNMSKIARAFSFTNTTKTAGKWALGVRVIIENGQADISSVLRGIKGGIE